VTYGIRLADDAQQFVDAVQSLDSVKSWIQDAAEEDETLPFIDARFS
jgi:hypothetical protein